MCFSGISHSIEKTFVQPLVHAYNGNLLISSGDTQPQRNVQSGDILERQEPTIKAADDATSCLSFINQVRKMGIQPF